MIYRAHHPRPSTNPSYGHDISCPSHPRPKIPRHINPTRRARYIVPLRFSPFRHHWRPSSIPSCRHDNRAINDPLVRARYIVPITSAPKNSAAHQSHGTGTIYRAPTIFAVPPSFAPIIDPSCRHDNRAHHIRPPKIRGTSIPRDGHDISCPYSRSPCPMRPWP